MLVLLKIWLIKPKEGGKKENLIFNLSTVKAKKFFFVSSKYTANKQILLKILKLKKIKIMLMVTIE